MRTATQNTHPMLATIGHPDAKGSAPGRDQVTNNRRGWLRFAGHYLEMVVAMLVGMFILGGALRAVLAAADVAYSMDRYPELVTLEMGLTMAVAMLGWMRFRGHGWAATLEMSGAMLVPAIAAVPLIALGVLDAGTAMTMEHVAMFSLMLAVMLRRREEYSAHTHGHTSRSNEGVAVRAALDTQ
jgi:flagellar biosynthetic protein FliP